MRADGESVHNCKAPKQHNITSRNSTAAPVQEVQSDLEIAVSPANVAFSPYQDKSFFLIGQIQRSIENKLSLAIAILRSQRMPLNLVQGFNGNRIQSFACFHDHTDVLRPGARFPRGSSAETNQFAEEAARMCEEDVAGLKTHGILPRSRRFDGSTA